MVLGNTHDETRAFIPREKLAGLNWDNLAGRTAPELKVDIRPEWVVSEYRRLFPAYTPNNCSMRRRQRRAAGAARSRRRRRGPRPGRRPGSTSSTFHRRWSRGWGTHTLDIPLVFGTLDAPGSIAGTGKASRAVSDAMTTAFTSLAATGDPNSRALPRWPAYRARPSLHDVFDAPPRVENDPRHAERELFARVPYIQPGT